MKNIFIGNLITKASSLLLMFLLVHSPNDLYLAAFVQSLSWCFVAFYSLAIIKYGRYCGFYKVSFKEIINTLRESFYIYLSVLATSLYTALNIIILSSFASVSAVAVYGIADKLRVATQAFIGIFSQALYPYFCTKTGRSKFGFWLFLAIGCLSGIVLYIASPIAIFLLAGSGFEESIKIARIFAFLCPIVSVASYYANLKIAANGHQRLFFIVYSLAAFMHLSYVFFFVRSYSYIGLAMSLILTEILITVLLFIGYKMVFKE